jgi:hypothetical protein
VKRLSLVGLVLTATLAACGRPAENAKPSAVAENPTVERAGPVRWNAASGAFEFNGKPMKTVKLWTFDGSTDGFTAVPGQITPASGAGLAVKVLDPTLHSPRGLNVPGGQYPLVLVRLTRIAEGSIWDGALYYSTPSHSESVAFFSKPVLGGKPAMGETTTMVYDMAKQTNGSADWSRSTIDQMRLDLEDKVGGAFVIHQIAIAEDPDPAALALAAPPAKAPKP